jgi:hypothetical protein
LKLLTRHLTEAKNSLDTVNNRYLSLSTKINSAAKLKESKVQNKEITALEEIE